SGAAQLNLQDMNVLVFLAPGIWQQQQPAKPTSDGVYEMSFVPPEPGVYYVFYQSPSLGLQFNQSAPLTLQAVQPSRRRRYEIDLTGHYCRAVSGRQCKRSTTARRRRAGDERHRIKRSKIFH